MENLDTPIFDLVLCLAQAVDLVSPLVSDHHKRTAQTAYGLGLQLGFSESRLCDLVMAAALHDVGGLTREDRLSALEFEYANPYGHAVMGYLLLRPFAPFKNVADFVRFHHVPWHHGANVIFDGVPVREESQIIHLADRVAVLIDPAGGVLEQVDGIMDRVRAGAGSVFVPAHVAALEALASREAFWLDSVYMQDLQYLGRRLHWQKLALSEDDFYGLTEVFRRIIDFRSPFTATHSAGVAAVAENLAKLCGFSQSDCHIIHLAGILHDLGKLAVPAEILEKADSLTREEFDIIRRHTYFTFHILEPLKILDVVRVWGALHHERIDGRGYPFHLEENEIPLGSRVVSVADIFTALTEDRPYRKGMQADAVMAVLEDASVNHRVDRAIVEMLRQNFSFVDEARRKAQSAAQEEYRRFVEYALILTHADEALKNI